MHASLPAMCNWLLYELAIALPVSFCVSHHFANYNCPELLWQSLLRADCSSMAIDNLPSAMIAAVKIVPVVILIVPSRTKITNGIKAFDFLALVPGSERQAIPVS